MSASTIIALIRFAVWVVVTIKEVYDNLTPEQKEEVRKDYEAWQEAIKNVQDPMGGGMDGP